MMDVMQQIQEDNRRLQLMVRDMRLHYPQKPPSHCDLPQNEQLAPVQLDVVELDDENCSCHLIQGCSIHVHIDPKRQHEASDSFVHPESMLQTLEGQWHCITSRHNAFFF